MTTVGVFVQLVDTWALYIGLESSFIGPLVSALATRGAPQIPFCLFKGVGTGRLLLGLLLEQVGNNLSSGELAGDGLVRAALVRILLFKLDLGTGLF